MLNDKIIYTICIISLVVSGIYASLIFQGVPMTELLSSLASLSTIGAFILALYITIIWKSQKKREFVLSELLVLTQQLSSIQNDFKNIQITLDSCKQKPNEFQVSMSNVLDFSVSLRQFLSTYQTLLGVDMPTMMNGELIKLRRFYEYVMFLESVYVSEKSSSNDHKTNVQVLYIAYHEPERLKRTHHNLHEQLRPRGFELSDLRAELLNLSKEL
ncbi:hypothetical protein A1QW_17450 [Vibrio anguillarum]|nr:hypothetical protein A1QW_17450 [Vibrio anguillarum]OEF92657.1 hypothetical protein A1QY_18035 [Vibrio anguillarum]